MTITAMPQNDAADAKPKKSRRKLILVVVAVVLILGAGAYFVLKPAGKPAAPKPGTVVKLDSIQINLAGGHYLRLGLALQETASTKEDVARHPIPSLIPGSHLWENMQRVITSDIGFWSAVRNSLIVSVVTAVSVVLECDSEIRGLIAKGAPLADIKTAAGKKGGLSLQTIGLARVKDGTTSVEEVKRATRPPATGQPKAT